LTKLTFKYKDSRERERSPIEMTDNNIEIDEDSEEGQILDSPIKRPFQPVGIKYGEFIQFLPTQMS
jgi:hypothetical protein